MVKKIALPFILALGLLGAVPAFSSETIVVSGNPYAPPVVWEEYKSLSGIGPDLVKDILDELGIPYTIKVMRNWQVVQDAAQKGDIDLIVSAYRNDARSAYLNFSIPYLTQQTVIIVEKGKEFHFAGWSALKGKKGVSGIGESYGQKFDAFIAENLDVSYYTLERAIETLNRGEADYLIIDLYTALIYAHLLQGEDAITILKPPVAVENFHLAVAKDSPLNQHLEAINNKLEERIEAGLVKELLVKHFDYWQARIARQSEYMSRFASENSAAQQEYLKKQGEMARQQLLGTMVDREGLPAAAE